MDVTRPAPPSALVGRDRELAELEVGLAECLRGRTAVFLIGGEPGIGKTSLAEALSGRAEQQGARVVWGRSAEGAGAPALWPWIQVLRRVIETNSDGPPASQVASVLPESHEDGLGLDGSIDHDRHRFMLFDRIARFLAASATSAPMVVVLDDLHAADASSIMLLEHCARSLRDAPILFVGTFREAEIRADPERSSAIGRIGREGTVVGLRGLDGDELDALIASTGLEVGSDARRRIRALTGGNPLFAKESARLTLQPGSASELPADVLETIRQRIRALSPHALGALEVASVVGETFTPAVVAIASGRSTEEVLDLLDECERAGLIRERDGADRRFTHALTREAVYEDLPGASRDRLHLQVGTALEALLGAETERHAATLAHHFVRTATDEGAARAAKYAEAAGYEALFVCAYEDARVWLQRALDATARTATVDDRLLFLILKHLATAERFLGHTEAANDAFWRAAEVARRIGDPALLATAALSESHKHTLAPDPAMLALIDEAIEALGESDLGSTASLMAKKAVLVELTDHKGAVGLLEEALRLARRFGGADRLVSILIRHVLVVAGPDDLPTRLAHLDEVLQLVETTAGMNKEARQQFAHTWRVHVQAELGDLRGMDHDLRAVERLARKVGRIQNDWDLAVILAARASLSGRLDEAERLANRAFEIGAESREADAMAMLALQTFCIRDLQGRLPEVASLAEEILAAQASIPTWRVALAYLYARLGRKEDAARELAPLLAGIDEVPRGISWLLVMAAAAQTAVLLGDRGACEILHERLLPYTDHNVVTFGVLSWGTVAHHLGALAQALGRDEEAERHLRKALEMHRRLEAPAWEALSSFALGSLSGNTDDGRRMIRRAMELAAELDMRDLVDDTRAHLHAYVGMPADSQPSDASTAILVTDLVSSTALLERLGEQRALSVFDEHHRLVRELIAAHRGREARFQGDGFMVTFDSVRDAVACALAIQATARSRVREDPESAVRVRAGIHQGDVVHRDGELHGRSLVVASRVADEAEAGEILISSVVREELDGGPDVVLGRPRRVELKGLRGPHTVYPLVWG